jgi:hypothetical protein
MDIPNLIGGIIAGTLSGGAVSGIAAFFANAAKEKWIADIKAEYDKELEQIKAALASDQKKLQAKLDQSSYVSKAQYDLEFSAYSKLWAAMSELRERWKEVYGLCVHGAQMKARIGEDAWNAKVKEADETFSKAYNNAILTSEQYAPFCEQRIIEATRTTTLYCQQVVLRLDQGTPPSMEEFKSNVDSIWQMVQEIDGFIRERLSNLRLAE